jgi:hypothetical protein
MFHAAQLATFGALVRQMAWRTLTPTPRVRVLLRVERRIFATELLLRRYRQIVLAVNIENRQSVTLSASGMPFSN